MSARSSLFLMGLAAGVTDELWRPAPGFPGYEVSNLGRVASLRRRPRRILSPYLNPRQAHGYFHVTLSCDSEGRRRRPSVHRLVAEAFHGAAPSPDHQVRHLDGNRFNNTAANLAWGTASENRLDRVRHGTDHNVAKTHCPQGHPYSAENTHLRRLSNGRFARNCRACWKTRNQQSWARRVAARRAADQVGAR